MSAKGRVLSLPKGIRWRMNPGDNPFAWSEGTSFPPYPATGDRCFRTDIRGGMLFRWSGTYWLSDQQFHCNGFVDSASAASIDFGRWPVPEYDIYVGPASMSYYVATTNNGSNFWTCHLMRGTAGATWTDLWAPDTSAGSTGTWVAITTNPGGWLVSRATYPALGMYAAKTGSPGNLWAAFSFEYRLRAV